MKKLRVLLLLTLFTCALSATLFAQSNPNSPSPAASDSSTTPQSQANAPAPTITEYSVPPAEYARAKAYSNAKYRHIFTGAFYGFLILLVILRWRVAPAFRNLAERVSTHRFL